MNLAKVGEVLEAEKAEANQFLGQGWVLLGFVERRQTEATSDRMLSRTIYILGKPREKPKRHEDLVP